MADTRDLKSRETKVSYRFKPGFRHQDIAEWSSLVARRAHNPKVVWFKSRLRNQKRKKTHRRLFSFLVAGTDETERPPPAAEKGSAQGRKQGGEPAIEFAKGGESVFERAMKNPSPCNHIAKQKSMLWLRAPEILQLWGLFCIFPLFSRLWGWWRYRAGRISFQKTASDRMLNSFRLR